MGIPARAHALGRYGTGKLALRRVAIKEERRMLRTHISQYCKHWKRTTRVYTAMEEVEFGEPPTTKQPEASDGKFSFSEIYDYIQQRRYSQGFSKVEKNALRRRSKLLTRSSITLVEV